MGVLNCGFAISRAWDRLRDEEEAPAVDASGNRYMTIEELKRQEAERRAGAARLSWLRIAAPPTASVS